MTFIIIVTYNAMPWLQKCLNSCQEHQVVVVDNNSADETVAFIKKEYPEIYLMPQKENLGFGQANNLGIRYALDKVAEYVFLLNQDAYLQDGCINKLISVHKQNPEYGILSPIHLNGQGNRLDRNFSNYVAYLNNPDFYSDFILNKPLKAIYDVPFVNAAGWLLPMKILETVGGFDPLFFHYGEDDNYCQRAKYFGFKIGIVPTAYLWHHREDRAKPQVVSGSKEYFKNMERTFKMRYANINVDNLSELSARLKKRKKCRIKAWLKFNFSELPYLNNEIKMLSQVIPKIQKSRERNKCIQANYL